MCKLEGTPEAVLNNEELMQLLSPMLRTEFEVNNSDVYEPRPPLDCIILDYGGMQDKDVSRESLEAWQE